MGRPMYKTKQSFVVRFGLSDLAELPRVKVLSAGVRSAGGETQDFATVDEAGDQTRRNIGEPATGDGECQRMKREKYFEREENGRE